MAFSSPPSLSGVADGHILERGEVERDLVMLADGLEKKEEAALLMATDRVSGLDIERCERPTFQQSL